MLIYRRSKTYIWTLNKKELKKIRRYKIEYINCIIGVTSDRKENS